MTKITALGTGAADSVKYFQTSFYIQDEKTNLLIDTGGGSGIRTQLDHFGIPFYDIKNIFISHKHIDHIFGIFWILRFRGAAIDAGKASDLIVYASQDNIDLIKHVSALFLKKKVIDLFDNKIKFVSLQGSREISLEDWKVSFFDIQSSKDSQWGCKIEFSNKKTLTYIGDETYSDAIGSFCENTDYLMHDAYCLEKDRANLSPQKVHHSTAKDAALVAQKVKAKNLIVFHTEDKITFGQRKSLYTEEIRQDYSGNIFVPEDGEIVEVK
jgi:ribonuclease Z